MKTKLRTLKDLDPYHSFKMSMDSYDDEIRVQHAINHALSLVKAEAVKHAINHALSLVKAEAVKDYKKWEKHPNGQNVCVYISWKNNLTDEDLK